MLAVIVFITGLAIGSFLNVCIYRIPRHISILRPSRSFCPSCNNRIKAVHNIPVISYLFLRGRCAYCKQKISIIYPVVELINAFLYLLLYLKYGLSLHLIFLFVFVSAMVAISFIDIKHYIVPDIISLPLILLGVMVSSNTIDAVFSVVVGSGVLLLASFFGQMGGGDIKLNGAVGAFLGWENSLLTIFTASVLGLIIGGIVYLKTGQKKLPFAPFICAGALFCLFRQ